MGALALYKQTVARSLIRRRPTNLIKRPFVPCWMFEDGESNKEEEGGDRQSVVVVAVSVPVSVYAFMQLDANIAQQ